MDDHSGSVCALASVAQISRRFSVSLRYRLWKLRAPLLSFPCAFHLERRRSPPGRLHGRDFPSVTRLRNPLRGL